MKTIKFNKSHWNTKFYILMNAIYHVIMSCAMDSGMNHVHVKADVLHDVDLTIGRPVDWPLGAQKPKCRPCAATFGQFRFHLVNSVLELTLRY